MGPKRTPIHGTVEVTGSKSWTNRALIIAAAAEGESILRNYLRSEDSYWCVESLRSLGVEIDVDKQNIRVQGSRGQWEKTDAVFVGSAGTTARFLTSVLAFSLREPLRITATSQMYRRPMAGLLKALTSLGAHIEYDGAQDCLPLRLTPSLQTGGSISMSGAISSQFVSGVLIGSPYASSPVTINVVDGIVQENYVRMTIEAMKAFGIEVDAQSDLSRFDIQPGVFRGAEYDIEADASTASYFFALAAVTGGDITISNLNTKTLQPDITVLSVFEKLGCQVTSTPKGLNIKGPTQLQGGFKIDLNQCSDTALTIAAIAPFASGPIEIVGVEHIRKHESDRVAVMAETLLKLGIEVDERRDGWLIQPGEPTYRTVDTHDDHRVAMSLAVLAVAANGLELLNPSCVSKTCPAFFDFLRNLEVDVS